MITVVHVNTPKAADAVRFYCGRPGLLGNPYVIGRDGDRNKVIERYRGWLAIKCAQKDSSERAQLIEIWRTSKTHNVELACYCAPQRCHCDIIKEMIRE